MEFDYAQAFDRNIGWLTNEDQTTLKNSCVAIAGVGGAGGFQAQVLARLGVGRFKLADHDTFELSNINRQIGATVATLGKRKTDVVREMIQSINPTAEVSIFSEKITERNVDAFIDGAQLVMDGIDYFESDAKFLLFQKSHEKHVPVLTSCPIGFGASLIVFSPNGMTYDQYFDLNEKMNETEKRLALTFGLSPSPLCLKYMNRDALNLRGLRAASVAPGLMLVGALSGAEAVKILTGKYKVRYCPDVYQIDLMTQVVKKKFLPFGMRSPWQRIKKRIILAWLKAHNSTLFDTK